MNLKNYIDEWSKVKIDPEYESSYGCLHIFMGAQTPVNAQKIRDSLIEIYSQSNLIPFDWQTFLKQKDGLDQTAKDKGDAYGDKLDQLFPLENYPLQLNTNPNICIDNIILLPEATDGWYEISSSAYEWTVPGLNPLALMLSRTFVVLSMTRIEDTYDEVCLYKNGKAISMYLSSIHIQDLLPEIEVTDFEWSYFDDKGSVASAEELRSVASEDFMKMIELAGSEAKGYRNNLIDFSIEYMDDESLLLFRPPPVS